MNFGAQWLMNTGMSKNEGPHKKTDKGKIKLWGHWCTSILQDLMGPHMGPKHIEINHLGYLGGGSRLRVSRKATRSL